MKIFIKKAILIVLLLTLVLTSTACRVVSGIINTILPEEDELIMQYIEEFYLFDYNPLEITIDKSTGVITGLDSYSRYLDAMEFYKIKNAIDEDKPMVGLAFQLTSSGWEIGSVVYNSPADKAGIRIGDKVVSINGNEVNINTPYDSLLRLLQANTAVDIIINREGELITFSNISPSLVERKYVEYFFVDQNGNAITNFFLKGDGDTTNFSNYHHYDDYFLSKIDSQSIGYIKLHQFTFTEEEAINRQTVEFNQAMELFKQAYNGKGKLILDLNNNPGGNLDYCIQVASYFIKGQENEQQLLVYQLVDKNNNSLVSKDENTANSVYDEYFDETQEDKQIVVLTNSNSASASEMLTGCMLVYQTAMQIGTQTYGKGIAQSMLPLKPVVIEINNKSVMSYTGLYFSIAYFKTPNYVHSNSQYNNYCNHSDTDGNGIISQNEKQMGFLPDQNYIHTDLVNQMISANSYFLS